MEAINFENLNELTVQAFIDNSWKDILALKHQPSTLLAECFKLFSTIANCTEETFMKYLNVIKPHLINIL